MSDEVIPELAIDDRSYEIGHSVGRFHAEMSAIKAYEMGEIDLWIEHHRPKSIEGWREWEKDHPRPEYPGRWEDQPD